MSNRRTWKSLRGAPRSLAEQSSDFYLTFNSPHGQAVLDDLFARYVAAACPDTADACACLRADAKRKVILEIISRFEEQRRVAERAASDGTGQRAGRGATPDA